MYNPLMAKKPARKRTPKPEPFRWQRLLRLIPAVVAVGGVFAGLHFAGQRAGAEVAARERYAVPVTELRVNTPPQLDTAKFLAEVRLLGNLPESVQSVDPNLPARLPEAFRKHPWVDDVAAVAVDPDGGVRVDLRFRAPVLVVRWNGTPRAVAADGVLLPVGADTAGLPVLTNERTVRDAADGQPWPEAEVKRAAELVTRHPCRQVERTRTGWRLTDADGKVLTIDAP